MAAGGALTRGRVGMGRESIEYGVSSMGDEHHFGWQPQVAGRAG